MLMHEKKVQFHYDGMNYGQCLTMNDTIDGIKPCNYQDAVIINGNNN